MVASRNTNRDGPVRLSRRFLQSAQAFGVVSVTYYYGKLFGSHDSFNLYLHFSGGKRASRYKIPDEQQTALIKCHDFIIENGRVLILSNILNLFRSVEPILTNQVMNRANLLGVFDQYMIPVYGPFNINGVISFGFPNIIDPSDHNTSRELIAIALSHHYAMVQHFGERRSDIDLSKRENEVLTWIARGKSSIDIASILGITVSSVDTYTRRIFAKMGVNDRVSAAVSGVVEGLIKPK